MKAGAYSKSIMASYATFKELYKSQKYNSPYQILSEFIKYIIVSKSLYNFTSTDIQGHLNSEFGFNPPIAVIRTAMRSISEVTRDHQTYRTSYLQGNTAFQAYRQQAEEKSKSITDALVKYAEEKNAVNLDKNRLSQELIAFVLDEEGDPQYQQVIGSFVLANATNAGITTAISAIREGSILYSGLAFNISEFGSINQQITLFLDTEILFDIAGLNGVLFKTLSDDFLNLVDAANRGGKVITLKFFSKVEDDIEQFYGRAERIVAGHGEINFTQAMKDIVDGCKDVSDVSDKKVELFRKLHVEHGIRKDEKANYYTDSDNAYNLEGLRLPDFSDTDAQSAEGYMFCSHINKLRKGQQTTDYLLSKFLCITDTRRVLEISRAIAEHEKNSSSGERYCDYAVSLSYITNLLWYKLNRGFGSSEFPKNLDVVIKARTILSGYITQGITTTYKEIRTKAATGELTQEQAAARIVALKEKATLPEDLDADNIEEALNFTEEHFAQFEETLAQNRRLLIERDKTIEELTGNVKELQGQLSQANTKNDEKQKQIDRLTERVNAIEEQERAKLKKKKDRIALIKFLWSIIWKILIVVAVGFVIWRICRLLKVDFPTWLGVALSAGGIMLTEIPSLRNRWDEYQEQIKKGASDRVGGGM